MVQSAEVGSSVCFGPRCFAPASNVSHLPGQFRQEVLDRQNFDAVDVLAARAEKDNDLSSDLAGVFGEGVEPLQIARVDMTRGPDLDCPVLAAH